jgi:hemolysin D
MRHGTATGKITTISEGSFTEGPSGTGSMTAGQSRDPFFKARIRIDAAQLHDVPANFRLIPGMTVHGDVLVGHRTILSYILESGMRTSFEAMREP